MSSGLSKRRNAALIAFELAIVLPTVASGVIVVVRDTESFKPELLVWILMVAITDLLPVAAWRGLQVSLAFPLLMTVGIFYSPAVVGVVALLGTTDPREYKREVSFLHAAFNRCQVALSVVAASAVYHAIAGPELQRGLKGVLGAMLAAVADYLINSGIVTLYVAIKTGLAPWAVIKELRIGRLSEFLVSYLGLAFLGLALAILFDQVYFWVLPAVFAPLIFARQMFFRSQALSEAHKELQDREQVLRALSNAMAEQRADERQKIAAYLHDDLAQVLFRLSIQVDVARKLLDKGDLVETGEQLEKIRESKQDTSDRIRALIRDLHRSPLGAKGLAESLESFTDEVGADSGVHFHLDVHDVAMPAPIALLIYHIAREGLMNSLKHAQATDFWITVRGDEEFLELQLRDNGVGFDSSAPGPEGHFGMTMMRQRAKIGGGTFEVFSVPDQGTTITVRFPTSLLQEDPPPPPEKEPGSGGPSDRISPGTPIGETVADGSRGPVHV